MKKLRFYIVLPDGRSYTVDHTGRVLLVNAPSPLQTPPAGHKETSIAWERDRTLRGVVRNFSTPYGFVLEGAKIVRELGYTGNVSTEVYLIIQHLITEVTDVDFAQYYRTIYKGLLDFSTMRDDRSRVDVSVGESGLRRLLNARRDTEYKIDLYKDTEVVSLRVDGLPLTERHTFIMGERMSGKIENDFGALMFTSQVNKEGAAAGFFVGGSSSTDDTPADLNASEHYTFGSTQEIIGVKMTGEIKPRDASFYDFYLLRTQGPQIDIVNGFSGSIDYKFEVVFNIAAGEKVFLIENNRGQGNFSRKESQFTIEFQSRHRTTYVPALRPFTVAKRLIGEMVNNEAALKPSVLLEANKGKLITSGDGLRGLVGASIKTSLSAFLKAFYVLTGAGLSIEKDEVIIEGYEYFYDFNKPAIELGTIDKPSIDYANDMVGNELRIGYKEQSYSGEDGKINGKLEFNNTSRFTTPITTVQKVIDLTTDWRTDSYGIENMRINLEGKTTVDDKGDNDIFILDATEQVVMITGSLRAHNDNGPSLSFATQIPYANTAGLNAVGMLIPGMKITLSGTVSNNKVFTIKERIYDGLGQSINDVLFTLLVHETVINEEVTLATITSTEWVLNRPNYDSIEGLEAGYFAFNVELSPAHLLENVHRKYINSLMYGFEGQTLHFQTTERNSSVKVVLNGKTYDEDAPFVIGKDRYFIPWVANFDTSINIALADEIEADANRPFSFELEGMRFAGILQKAAIAPASKKPQSFRLLLGPNEDLTKLKK